MLVLFETPAGFAQFKDLWKEFSTSESARQALFRALKTKHATPKYRLIFHASLIGQAPPKLKGKISRSLAAKAALAIRYDALGDSEDSTMGLENRAKVEARLRVLEGRELGRSAGSTKGKPKIEFYDKDRKKGAGALITPAKTYNPSSDLVLSQSTEPAAKKLADEQEGVQPKKRKHEEVDAAEEATLKEGGDDDGEKRKKKKKKKADIESTQLHSNDQTAAVEVKEERKGKKKKKKKAEVQRTAVLENEDQAALPEAVDEPSMREKKKKKKRKQTEAGEEPGNQIKEQEAAEKEKKNRDKKDE